MRRNPFLCYLYDEFGVFHQPDPRMDAAFSSRGRPLQGIMDMENIQQSYLNYRMSEGERAARELEAAARLGVTPEAFESVSEMFPRVPAPAYRRYQETQPANIARARIGQLDPAATDFYEQVSRINLQQGLGKESDILRLQGRDVASRGRAIREGTTQYARTRELMAKQGVPAEKVDAYTAAMMLRLPSFSMLPEDYQESLRQSAATLGPEDMGRLPMVEQDLAWRTARAQTETVRNKSMQAHLDEFLRLIEPRAENLSLRNKLLRAHIDLAGLSNDAAKVRVAIANGQAVDPKTLDRNRMRLAALIEQREELQTQIPIALGTMTQAGAEAQQRKDLKALNEMIASLQTWLDAAQLLPVGPAERGDEGASGLPSWFTPPAQ